MNSLPLSVLDAKRNELEKQVRSVQAKIARIESDLNAMKMILSLHAQNIVGVEYLPSMDLRPLFARNELFDTCLDSLRINLRGLTSRDLAEIVADKKGLDSSDLILVGRVARLVSAALQKAQRRRLIEQSGRRHGVTVWRFCRPRILDV